MEQTCKLGFAGTDARTLLSALTVSSAKSSVETGKLYRGVVVRGTSAMSRFADKDIMNWDIDFIPTKDNSVDSYSEAIISAINKGDLDYVVPMPESLFFNGIVDRLDSAGLGDRIAGLSQNGAFIEGDKIKCKELCKKGGIPVADAWSVADAGSFDDVLEICLDYIHKFGGAVLKYPFSAGGKGARVILNAWEIREVYDGLMHDYRKLYKKTFRKKEWPLLIESRMSGVEISFTILVDGSGHYQVLPTSMDYPERFAAAASKDNPVTGGMGSISPHPFEMPSLIEMVKRDIATPLVKIIEDSGLLRPCILYPGCFVSFKSHKNGEIKPVSIRVCEINIRPGEPEFQTVMRRLRNPGQLFEAMFNGCLDKVCPEIRDNQIALCVALVTGPGGPDGQKGYPWSVTKNEPVVIDFSYMKKKKIQIIPAAMGYSEEKGLVSDGTRVAYMNINGAIKLDKNADECRGAAAEIMRNKIHHAFDGGKIRVIPREDVNGNRLALRDDIGIHFAVAEKILNR